MNTSNLWSYDLVSLSDALSTGRITSRHLTEALLNRIAQDEPRLHAFATRPSDAVLEQAEIADAERRAGRIKGPLHGIPIAVKDAIDDSALPAAFGNPDLHRNRKGAPSTVMTRLREAGAIAFGKLTLTEGVWVEHHRSVAPPINPYGKDHWTGTSSSGSGVALAAGFVPGSFGTDTGGSIRLPSGCCGVTGLKPTWGRIGVSGVHPLAPSFDTVGPMARTARDVAILMDAVAGPDPSDPTCLSDPLLSHRVGPDADIRGLRLGVSRREIVAADTAVQTALNAAIETFLALGVEVVDLDLPDPEPVISAWSILISAEAARVHHESFAQHPEAYGTAMTQLITRGRSRSNPEIIDAMAMRRRHRGTLSATFSTVDAVLLPALPIGGPSNAKMNSFADDDEATQVIGRYTVPFNMSGFPTLTLPCGRTDLGIPIGLQLCGLPLTEPRLCRMGAAFQDVTTWHGVAP
ncbi:amidase [Celeribacter sp. SCSIO 80788]|uniref:amidase n=1 Tax=Celeribacter sp. SCSIO 80788 TaxID=3117013 RepID=UPI003DA67CB9